MNRKNGSVTFVLHSVIKLTTFCLDATLAAKLRDIAFDHGQLMAEASRLLNMYVLQRLEAGLDVNLETSNVVRQAIVLVSSEAGSAPDAGLAFTYNTLYLPCRPEGLPRRRRHSSQMTTIASQTLHRNIKAHVLTHFGKRLYKWVKLAALRATAAPGEYHQCRLNKDQHHAVASDVMDALLLGNADLPADGAIARVLQPDEAQQLAAWYADVRAAFGHLFPLKGVHWWSLYPVMLRMCADACDQRAACEAQDKRPRIRLLKPMTMTPLCGFTTGHVHLDTAALSEVVRGMTPTPRKPKRPKKTAAQQDVSSEKDALWRKWFDVDAATTASRTFGHYINTDGVAVSVRLWVEGRGDDNKEDDKLCVRTSAQADKELLKQTNQLDAAVVAADLPDIHDKSACRVVAIDPGTRSPTSGVVYDPDAAAGVKSEGFHMSLQEWRTMAGITRAGRRRAVWLSKSEPVAASGVATPSPKVVTTEAFGAHVAHVLNDLELLREYYGSVRWRNERFRSYGKRLKALEAVVAKIAPPGVKTVVAFGAGGSGQALRGNPASPSKRIEK